MSDERYTKALEAHIDVLRSKVNALTAENVELMRDAGRYRWLRKAGAWESEIEIAMLSENPEMFDQRVDLELAALKAKQ